MRFARVADTAEVVPERLMAVVVDGRKILLANVGGSYYAIADRCTHAGGSLSKGVLEGETVACPRHGARFDVKTGKAVGEAKIGFMKMKVQDEESYPVKVDGTDILVGLPG
jgi:3-phenylpropionate/trans-cinnamate dioxygenase ferredoxin subunit